MATQALYRKWRSRTFEEVIGQGHVTRTLQNALTNDRVVHAYLFTGPRGTGKTTTARLLAKAVNCVGDTDTKPCGTCRICQAVDEGRLLDLIEIDAASNRGIDEIRDLREKVGFRPGEARIKFYIIDEVHMLTEPAFNALLKTLEEPPSHVMFVLATTEPHKIPATIISRCQRFDFRRIPLSDIAGRLTQIATEEGLSITPPAIEYIARQAGGSLRDAISLLDQLTAYAGDTITIDQIQAVLGTVASQAVAELADRVIDRDITRGLTLINQVTAEGTEPRQFTRDLVDYLRRILLLKMGDGAGMLQATASETEIAAIEKQAGRIEPQRLLRTIRLFNAATQEMKSGFLPQLPLELAFLESCEDQPTATVTTESRPLKPAQAVQPESAVTREAPPSPSIAAPPPPVRVAESAAPASPPPSAPEERLEAATTPASDAGGTLTLDQVERQWRDILMEVRKVDRIVQGLLNSVQLVGVEGNSVIVEANDWLLGRIDQPRIKAQIEPCFARVLGTSARLRVVVEGQYQRAQAAPVTEPAGPPTAVEGPDEARGAEETIPASQAQNDAPPTAEVSISHVDPMVDEGLKLGGVISNLDF